MSTIRIECSHRLRQGEAKKRVEGVISTWVDRGDVRGEWGGDTFVFEKPGRGTCAVAADYVRIEIDLPATMGPARRSLEGKIKDEIGRCLG